MRPIRKNACTRPEPSSVFNITGCQIVNIMNKSEADVNRQIQNLHYFIYNRYRKKGIKRKPGAPLTSHVRRFSGLRAMHCIGLPLQYADSQSPVSPLNTPQDSEKVCLPFPSPAAYCASSKELYSLTTVFPAATSPFTESGSA